MNAKKTVGLSKAVLEMKFMKRTRERIEKAEAEAASAKEAAGEGGLYASEVTEAMKRGIQCYTEPSFASLLGLLDGRRSYGGMNPEIERLTKLEENPSQMTPMDEADVSDKQMAQFYNPLVNTVKNKFSKSNKNRNHNKNDDNMPKKISMNLGKNSKKVQKRKKIGALKQRKFHKALSS